MQILAHLVGDPQVFIERLRFVHREHNANWSRRSLRRGRTVRSLASLPCLRSAPPLGECRLVTRDDMLGPRRAHDGNSPLDQQRAEDLRGKLGRVLYRDLFSFGLRIEWNRTPKLNALRAGVAMDADLLLAPRCSRKNAVVDLEVV